MKTVLRVISLWEGLLALATAGQTVLVQRERDFGLAA
jgi:hypothetical protein